MLLDYGGRSWHDRFVITHEQFNSQLHAWRTRLTLDAIGKELGVTRQAVYEWMKGSSIPSNTVLLLAERLMKDKKGKLNGRAGRESDSIRAAGTEGGTTEVPQVPTRATGVPVKRGANRSRPPRVDLVVRALRPHAAHAVPRHRPAARIKTHQTNVKLTGNPNRDYAAEWTAWRLEQGWTHEQVAQVLDVTVNTVLAIEGGRRPRIGTRERMKELQKRYREASA